MLGMRRFPLVVRNRSAPHHPQRLPRSRAETQSSSAAPSYAESAAPNRGAIDTTSDSLGSRRFGPAVHGRSFRFEHGPPSMRAVMNRWLAVLLGLVIGVACGRPAPSTPSAAAAQAQVVIVGGGIAGLVAARELEQRGVSVRVLEMSDRLGGRIATAHYGPGLMAEYGMQ